MNKFLVSISISITVWIFATQLANAQTYPEPYDVIIDIGHGGIDGGTSLNNILEKDINLIIGKKLYTILQKHSYRVGLTRSDDRALSDGSPFPHIRSRHLRDLMQRKLIADSLKPKLFISLHVNWSKNKNSRGPLVIYQPDNKSYALANLVQHHLNAFYGIDKIPLKGKTYFLMKHLKMPSIIVEMGFISNARDFSILTQNETQEKIAIAISHSIQEYFLLYPF